MKKSKFIGYLSLITLGAWVIYGMKGNFNPWIAVGGLVILAIPVSYYFTSEE